MPDSGAGIACDAMRRKAAVGPRGLCLALLLASTAFHVSAQCTGSDSSSGCSPPDASASTPPPAAALFPAPGLSYPLTPPPPPASIGALLTTITCPAFGASPFPSSTDCSINVCPGLTLVMGTCDMPQAWTCYGNDTVIALNDSNNNRIGAHTCASSLQPPSSLAGCLSSLSGLKSPPRVALRRL